MNAAHAEGNVGRVLVVDDDGDVCAMIADVLDEAELSSVCVHTDREAYAAIPTIPTIRALVVDVNLGEGVSGFDVARFARAVIPTLPVLFVSGEVPERSFRSNGVEGSDFLPKPFTPGDLLSKLNALLK